MPFRIIYMVGFFFLVVGLTAQETLLDSLPVVEVVDLRTTGDNNTSCGVTSKTLGISPTDPLSDLLVSESNIYIKSYGLGSLATSSVRGGSAGQTAVLWNGLPIENPMLGLLDLSQLPSSFFSEMKIFLGGQSAGWGSGAVAGVIALNNEPARRSQMGLTLVGGQFGYRSLNANVTLQDSSGRWQSVTRLLRNSADNDFTYRLREDLPEKIQVNADYQQSGIMQEVYFRPSQRETFSLQIWGQTTDRNLPPTTVQNFSEASQEDDLFRVSLGWKRTGKRHHFKSTAGLFRETIDYRDPLNTLRSISHFWRAVLEVEDQFYLNDNHRISAGLSSQWIEAKTPAYGDPQTQLRLAPWLAYRYSFKGGNAQVNLRQETVDGRFLPLIPSLVLSFDPLKNTTFTAKVSRNYRLPTLNDLYWDPGGNPNIKPESGWSQEASLIYKHDLSPGSIRLSATGYHRLLNNWIQWAPAGSFWSAFNLTRVRSRGLETRANVSTYVGQVYLGIELGHDLTVSTNEVAIELPRLNKGQQLSYVPRHQLFASMQLSLGRFYLRYQHRHIGSVRGQNVERLDAYEVGDFKVAYTIKKSKVEYKIYGEAYNAWNETYRVIERRVMPSRNFRLGISVTID